MFLHFPGSLQCRFPLFRFIVRPFFGPVVDFRILSSSADFLSIALFLFTSFLYVLSIAMHWPVSGSGCLLQFWKIVSCSRVGLFNTCPSVCCKAVGLFPSCQSISCPLVCFLFIGLFPVLHSVTFSVHRTDSWLYVGLFPVFKSVSEPSVRFLSFVSAWPACGPIFCPLVCFLFFSVSSASVCYVSIRQYHACLSVSLSVGLFSVHRIVSWLCRSISRLSVCFRTVGSVSCPSPDLPVGLFPVRWSVSSFSVFFLSVKLVCFQFFGLFPVRQIGLFPVFRSVSCPSNWSVSSFSVCFLSVKLVCFQFFGLFPVRQIGLFPVFRYVSFLSKWSVSCPSKSVCVLLIIIFQVYRHVLCQSVCFLTSIYLLPTATCPLVDFMLACLTLSVHLFPIPQSVYDLSSCFLSFILTTTFICLSVFCPFICYIACLLVQCVPCQLSVSWSPASRSISGSNPLEIPQITLPILLFLLTCLVLFK